LCRDSILEWHAVAQSFTFADGTCFAFRDQFEGQSQKDRTRQAVARAKGATSQRGERRFDRIGIAQMLPMLNLE
jgi:hypothetical protein